MLFYMLLSLFLPCPQCSPNTVFNKNTLGTVMRMTLVLVLVLDPSRKVRCTRSGVGLGQLRHSGMRMSAAVDMEGMENIENMEKKVDMVI